MATTTLNHTPAEIARRLLIDKGWGADATGKYREVNKQLGKEQRTALEYWGSSWPVFAEGEPEGPPDSIIVVRTTAGVQHGRRQADGRIESHFGLQFAIRAAKHTSGRNKAMTLADQLDQETTMVNVSWEGSVYEVWSIGRTGDVMVMGADAPNSKRKLFTINALMAVVLR